MSFGLSMSCNGDSSGGRGRQTFFRTRREQCTCTVISANFSKTKRHMFPNGPTYVVGVAMPLATEEEEWARMLPNMLNVIQLKRDEAIDVAFVDRCREDMPGKLHARYSVLFDKMFPVLCTNTRRQLLRYIQPNVLGIQTLP